MPLRFPIVSGRARAEASDRDGAARVAFEDSPRWSFVAPAGGRAQVTSIPSSASFSESCILFYLHRPLRVRGAPAACGFVVRPDAAAKLDLLEKLLIAHKGANGARPLKTTPSRRPNAGAGETATRTTVVLHHAETADTEVPGPDGIIEHRLVGSPSWVASRLLSRAVDIVVDLDAGKPLLNDMTGGGLYLAAVFVEPAQVRLSATTGPVYIFDTGRYLRAGSEAGVLVGAEATLINGWDPPMVFPFRVVCIGADRSGAEPHVGQCDITSLSVPGSTRIEDPPLGEPAVPPAVARLYFSVADLGDGPFGSAWAATAPLSASSTPSPSGTAARWTLKRYPTAPGATGGPDPLDLRGDASTGTQVSWSALSYYMASTSEVHWKLHLCLNDRGPVVHAYQGYWEMVAELADEILEKQRGLLDALSLPAAGEAAQRQVLANLEGLTYKLYLVDIGALADPDLAAVRRLATQDPASVGLQVESCLSREWTDKFARVQMSQGEIDRLIDQVGGLWGDERFAEQRNIGCEDTHGPMKLDALSALLDALLTAGKGRDLADAILGDYFPEVSGARFQSRDLTSNPIAVCWEQFSTAYNTSMEAKPAIEKIVSAALMISVRRALRSSTEALRDSRLTEALNKFRAFLNDSSIKLMDSEGNDLSVASNISAFRTQVQSQGWHIDRVTVTTGSTQASVSRALEGTMKWMNRAASGISFGVALADVLGDPNSQDKQQKLALATTPILSTLAEALDMPSASKLTPALGLVSAVVETKDLVRQADQAEAWGDSQAALASRVAAVCKVISTTSALVGAFVPVAEEVTAPIGVVSGLLGLLMSHIASRFELHKLQQVIRYSHFGVRASTRAPEDEAELRRLNQNEHAQMAALSSLVWPLGASRSRLGTELRLTMSGQFDVLRPVYGRLLSAGERVIMKFRFLPGLLMPGFRARLDPGEAIVAPPARELTFELASGDQAEIVILFYVNDDEWRETARIELGACIGPEEQSGETDLSADIEWFFSDQCAYKTIARLEA